MRLAIASAGLVVILLALASISVKWLVPTFQAGANGSANAVKLGQPASAAAKAELPPGPNAPAIVSDTWLNSAPLTPQELRGKVVLVEFWTFDCINCQHTIPYIRALYVKYRAEGLVVIGVHSPELPFEHDLGNVKQAIHDQDIPYPVAIDNDMRIWKAFSVRAWPTWYVLDQQGQIRFSHVGEGAYDETDQAIAELLGK